MIFFLCEFAVGRVVSFRGQKAVTKVNKCIQAVTLRPSYNSVVAI